MDIRVQNVTVYLNKMAAPSKQVWPWELPVLEEKYPGGLVERKSEVSVQVEEVPKADEEYNRLGMAYGGDPERGVSYVELAYGRGRAGVSALGQAIQQAAAGQAPPNPGTAAEEGDEDPTSSEPQPAATSDQSDDDDPAFDDDPGPDGEPADPLG